MQPEAVRLCHVLSMPILIGLVGDVRRWLPGWIGSTRLVRTSARRCEDVRPRSPLTCPNMDRDAARKRAWLLFRSLEKIAERDPEQEVQGMALPVLDACLQAFKGHVSDDPIVSAIREVISPESIEAGESVRAVDASLVAGQLAAALGPEHSASAW
jgi:hypothetical protein